MLNLYQALKSFPPFSRQLVCKGMLFTNYDCPQEISKMQMYIEHNYIVYVIKGRRIYHHQNHSWELKEGSCAFIKRGGFVVEKPKDELWCVIVFFVLDDFLRHMLKENRNILSLSDLPEWNNEQLIPLNVNEISKTCFASMLPYFTQSPPPHENLVELKFKELVLSLMVNSENTELLSFLKELESNSRVSIHQIMQNNFSYNLSIADLANLSCRSVSTFKRDFKKHFNETPARWVLMKRLNMAKELLQNTSLPVTEVSMECGFENSAHFSRVFKDKTGISPLHFRQQSTV
jgi:AraC-like DNA-binding protein